MQAKLKIVLLAGLVSATCIPAAFATPSANIFGQASNEQVGPIESASREAWRKNMAQIGTPSEGCFHATYPSIIWEHVACNKLTLRTHPAPPRVTFDAFGKAQTTGNGHDYTLQTASLLTQAVGSFPSVTGVTSEQGVNVMFGGSESNGIVGPNEYTLQLNSNFSSTTAACKGGQAGCTVWQQFIYGTDLAGPGQGAVFMQYWLLGYVGSSTTISCPSGYNSDGQGSCYMNSDGTVVPNIPGTDLGSMKLTGAVATNGNDTVTLTYGTQAYSDSGKDSVLYLSQVWNLAEFNVVGNADGSEAVFNNGSSITVNVAATDGSSNAPSCVADSGTTGETNNLNLGSCTASGGSTPSIQFTESNAANGTFATLPALQVTTPIPGSKHTPNDFNGDGISDLLWFNPSTSQIAYWLMSTDASGSTLTRIGAKVFNVTPGYAVGATGDFNGDGLADLVFTSANNDLWLWTNDGKGGFTSSKIGTYPAGWQLVGAGDVDGDGKDDLLWVNPTTCQFAYWLMNGNQRVGAKTISYPCGYYPLTIGYYTPSNRITIIWTSAQQDLYAWDSTGDGFTSSKLGNYATFSTLSTGTKTLIGLGGGFAGTQMSLGASGPNSVSNYEEDVLTRTFNQTGQALSYTTTLGQDGGLRAPTQEAGFLILGNGVNLTGLITQSSATSISICGPVNDTINPAPTFFTCPQFSFPQGWYLVGAMSNNIPPPVWP
jgi:VCBS repeat protein